MDAAYARLPRVVGGMSMGGGVFVPTPVTYYSGPGDVIGAGSFSAYWGLRAFSRATIGNKAVQLRRSSDNTTMDIATLSDGGLDALSIATFAGGSSLKVVKFYDQTGNGNDIVPEGTTFEQAFTPNILNGRGMYDNTANNGTTYRVATTSTICLTYSHCFFAVYLTTAPASIWQSLVVIGANEIGMIANDGGGGHNPAVKNEGGSPGTFLFGPTTTDGQWHAVASTVNQNTGSTSFILVDNPSGVNTVGLVGTPSLFEAFICVWGDDGNGPSTNQLRGYGAEAAWFATPPPASPWTQAQGQLLVANARSFWGF